MPDLAARPKGLTTRYKPPIRSTICLHLNPYHPTHLLYTCIDYLLRCLLHGGTSGLTARLHYDANTASMDQTQKWATDPVNPPFWGVLFCASHSSFFGPGGIAYGRTIGARLLLMFFLQTEHSVLWKVRKQCHRSTSLRTSYIVITPWYQTGLKNTNKTHFSGFPLFSFIEILTAGTTVTFLYRYDGHYPFEN
jgi:hypothetical protein